MYRKYGKRSLDILLGLSTLPIQILVFLVVAPVIKISDGGPIFYNAERRGYQGRIFKMFKYRTMVVDAPDLRNSDFSTVNSKTDSRITRVGRILRKSSLDELPQILNVLKGDMSFIGPRPNLTKKNIADFSDLEHRRLDVLPGITGLAQCEVRNSADICKKYELDVFYVENYSFFLDLKIMLKTIARVLKQKNIYSDS